MFVRRFMESLFVLRTCIVTMNRFEKLRRSAMSIAAADPDPLPSSVGAACWFVGSWGASTFDEHAFSYDFAINDFAFLCVLCVLLRLNRFGSWRGGFSPKNPNLRLGGYEFFETATDFRAAPSDPLSLTPRFSPRKLSGQRGVATPASNSTVSTVSLHHPSLWRAAGDLLRSNRFVLSFRKFNFCLHLYRCTRCVRGWDKGKNFLKF